MLLAIFLTIYGARNKLLNEQLEYRKQVGLKDYLKEDEIMKLEIEKDFLKHYEKYINSTLKIKILDGEAANRRLLNDKANRHLRNWLRKKTNRIYAIYDTFEEPCRILSDNGKRMKSLLSEKSSVLDEQRKIIDDMKNIAKITGKAERLKLSSLLKESNSLQMMNNEIQIKFFSKYCLAWRIAELSSGTRYIIDNAYYTTLDDTASCDLEVKGNLNKLIKLNNEIVLLSLKMFGTQRQPAENKVVNKVENNEKSDDMWSKEDIEKLRHYKKE